MLLDRLQNNLVSVNPRRAAVLKRLHAWWEGYYVEEQTNGGPNGGVSMSALMEVDDPEKRSGAYDDGRVSAAFSDPRVRIMEQLFGEGFTGPGGPMLIRELIQPLGLDSSMTVLDIGSGLGGAARTIHSETGAWVTGYESSPLYVDAAMELSELQGLGRKAPVQGFDPEHLELKPNGSNAIFSKDAFFTVKNKEGLFEALHDGLKTDGQLLFTDYMAKKNDASGAAVDAWVAGEPVKPQLWTLDQVRGFLSDLGFEIRVTEDVSKNTCDLITQSWGKVGEMLSDKADFSDGLGPALLSEAELWMRRMKVLQSGQVGAFRIYGRKMDPSLRR